VTGWLPLGSGLRCVLFHDLATSEGPFTRGLGVTITPAAFEDRIRFLLRHYEPIDLDGVLDPDHDPRRRPLLVTFDDAYGSVAREGVPILERYGIPAVFFVNAASVEGDHLPIDNLVCFVANTSGLDAVRSAADEVGFVDSASLRSVPDVIAQVVSGLDAASLGQFAFELRRGLSVDPVAEARSQQLFLTAAELRALPAAGVEVGSHTYHHVWCRQLDDAAADIEILHNAEALEAMTGRAVRAFSVPYGSSLDLTPTVASAITRAGHPATFLVEARSNRETIDLAAIQRVSLADMSDLRTGVELEVLPRLRRLRDRVGR
jgi:peptidoglycan/xylan/chitin deacetylase (PgdA/CDA1 family)